ncbi:alpha/beta hydrolase [Pedobacter rhizosphaerae]|uniref:Phospholipase/carboxylesterase n=1 Tax=Pedobacter rhizosphaerae TaxID=390241 RepID=A0A1H9QYH1_9SPHI|nr:alpha/beta hydrolase [Pedobacter rhizosphaerae]SER65641.1 phospholipase/carboxylesterase [Pedobacter rhizosphaerae]
MEYQPLKYIYKPSGIEGANTLLLLHGTGGNEQDLLPIADYFGNRFNVLSVRGNVSEHGMPRFFKRLGMGVFDEKDLQFRTEELIHFLGVLATKEGFDPNKIIALGYSNGANIAGSVLVTHPDLWSGAILFRPMQPYQVMPAVKNEKGIPVFMSSGKSDHTVAIASVKGYQEALNNGGFNATLHQINTSHGLTQEDIELAVGWFNQNFK